MAIIDSLIAKSLFFSTFSIIYPYNHIVNFNCVIRHCLDKTIHDNRKKKVINSFFYGNILAQYIAITEASKETGISKVYISICSKGKRENSDGFIWNNLEI